MDSQRESDLSEAKDFIQEKWSIVESERIAIEKEEARKKGEAHELRISIERKEKIKARTLATLRGILGALIGGVIGVIIVFIIAVITGIMMGLFTLFASAEPIINIILVTIFIACIVLGAILGATLGAKKQ